MRHFIFICIAVLLSSFFTWLVADRAATAQAHTATVVSDEENGAVRIVIDGKEIARFSAQGLHVEGSITADNTVLVEAVRGEPAPVDLPARPDAP